MAPTPPQAIIQSPPQLVFDIVRGYHPESMTEALSLARDMLGYRGTELEFEAVFLTLATLGYITMYQDHWDIDEHYRTNIPSSLPRWYHTLGQSR